MITNKDVRVENGNLILNGDKFPLDGQSPEAILQIVEDNSDSTPTENSTAPVTSGGVFAALAGKEDTLTFDTAPTAESTNPVTSAGIKTYVDNAILPKLSLFESIQTTTGNSISFTKQLENDKNYLVIMSAPTTSTGRRQRLSFIVLGNNNINEVYVGDLFSLTVTDRRLTITTENVTYGIIASILQL